MLLLDVCEKFLIHPAVVFKLAFEYEEVRMSQKNIQKLFEKCCRFKKRKNGYSLYAVEIEPQEVQDFCLDLLSDRTKLPINYPKGKLMEI